MTANTREELSLLNRTYRPALMAFFIRRLRNHAEAEDMTQDVFVRLAKADRRSMNSPDAYIFQIATNLLRDRARRDKYRIGYRDELMADEAFGVDPLDPSRVVSGKESLAVLIQALDDLPRLTRRVFICHRLEAIPRASISQAFNISEGAVDRHLAKAMAYLTQRVRGA